MWRVLYQQSKIQEPGLGEAGLGSDWHALYYWIEIPFAWTIMKAPIARVSGAIGQARSSGSVWHAGSIPSA